MHNHPRYRVAQRDDERGASLIEYALLLALIAVVTFSAVAFFGGSNAGGFGKSKSCMQAAYDGQAIPAECG